MFFLSKNLREKSWKRERINKREGFESEQRKAEKSLRERERSQARGSKKKQGELRNPMI